jgi:hypothetical protein
VPNALPHDQFEYTPHAKSQSASEIISTLIGETDACRQLIQKGELTFGAPATVRPAGQIEAFVKGWDDLLQTTETTDEATWNKTGRFLMDGHVRMEQPIGQFFWLFFFDAIHHRGQLSTYVHPMGGRVPSIYGPSGDDPMMLSVSHKRME